MGEKPLFVPLRGEWFDAFESGAKGTEFRALGPRWNARTCRIGRRVVLSRGYGKARRLSGVIVGFAEVCPDADAALSSIFPGVSRFAAIEIALDRKGAE